MPSSPLPHQPLPPELPPTSLASPQTIPLFDAYLLSTLAATRGADASLSEQDRRTLKHALGLLKAARADLKSKEATAAEKARQQLILVVTYLSGFFDGKHIPAFNPGFASVAEPLAGDTDFDSQMAELEKSLEEVLVSTRFAGMIVVGGLLIGGGILIKSTLGK
jgi:hypothetical protein